LPLIVIHYFSTQEFKMEQVRKIAKIKEEVEAEKMSKKQEEEKRKTELQEARLGPAGRGTQM
jgi:hypothetical protein